MQASKSPSDLTFIIGKNAASRTCTLSLGDVALGQ
jgi:hypothetical protein